MAQSRRELGIGVLGRGFMCKAHTNAFKTIGYMFEPNYAIRLAAVCASTKENAKAAAERYNYSKYYDRWMDMAHDPEVEIFDNCAPDALHIEPTIEAAKAGKHVLCEKPLAVGSKNAKAMLEAVRAAGVKHMCVFNHRFFPAVRIAWELIQSGRLGKIYHMHGSYLQDLGRSEDTPAESLWYTQGESGISQGIASHLVDMSRFLVGEIASVTGRLVTYNKVRDSKDGKVEIQNDEGTLSLVEFANGATGTFECLGVATGCNNQLSWEIYGSKGALKWNLEKLNHLLVFGEDSGKPGIAGFTEMSATGSGYPLNENWWPIRGANLGWEHGHVNCIAHFLDCIVNNKDVAPYGATFEDGYKVAVILDAIKESSRLRKSIDIVY